MCIRLPMARVKIVAISFVTLIIGFFAVQNIIANEKGKQNLVEVKTNLVITDTYFEFVGALGQEADITQWEATANSAGCTGDNKACKILVKADFLMEDAFNEIIIDSSKLLTIPVVKGKTGLHNVPDPTAAGTNVNQPIVDQQIHNKT